MTGLEEKKTLKDYKDINDDGKLDTLTTVWNDQIEIGCVYLCIRNVGFALCKNVVGQCIDDRGGNQ